MERGPSCAGRAWICPAVLPPRGRAPAGRAAPMKTVGPLPPGEPQVRATAVVISRKGKVELQRGFLGDWSDAQVGDRLAPSDALRTHAGEAEVGVDGVKMRVHEASALRLKDANDRWMRAQIKGSVESEVEPGRGSIDVEVEGSGARAHSQGGHFFVTADGRGVIAVAAVTGSVNLSAHSKNVEVKPGTVSRVAGGGPEEASPALRRVLLAVPWPQERATSKDTVPVGAKVSLSTNLGNVGDLQPAGDGEFPATFTPPRSRVPAVALLAADAEVDGDHALGWLALPLAGSDSMTLETKPHAKVQLRIADRDFGPAVANAKGEVQVQVVVPPGVEKATMHVEDTLGNTADPQLDLDPPRFARMRVLPVGPAQAASGESLELQAFLVRRDGSPDAEARVTASAGRGGVDVSRNRR